MTLFEITKEGIRPRSHTLLIKEFKDIYNLSKNKDETTKFLAYVFYIADYKSVYQSYSPEEREEVLKEDLGLPKDWKEPKEVQLGISKYKKLQETPTMRYLNAQMKTLEDLINFFKGLDLNERDKSGKPIWKPKEITGAMTDSAKVAESLEKLKEKVKKEEMDTGRIRGGGIAGDFEDAASMDFLRDD